MDSWRVEQVLMFSWVVYVSGTESNRNLKFKYFNIFEYCHASLNIDSEDVFHQKMDI